MTKELNSKVRRPVQLGKNLGGETPTPPQELPSLEVCTVICNDIVTPGYAETDCTVKTWIEHQPRTKDADCHCVDFGMPIVTNYTETPSTSVECTMYPEPEPEPGPEPPYQEEVPVKDECIKKGGHYDKCNKCVVPPQKDCEKTPCEKASDQIDSKNLKEKIKELNEKAKKSSTKEWGTQIKVGFDANNTDDIAKHKNGQIIDSDNITEGNNCETQYGITSCSWLNPPYGYNNNPRVIGNIHSHPDENTCFSPQDIFLLKDACTDIPDGEKKNNYLNDYLEIVVTPGAVYTLKVTDPGGLCDFFSNNNFKAINDQFLDLASKPINASNEGQGQEVALLNIFGKLISVQKAEAGVDGNIGDFKHIELNPNGGSYNKQGLPEYYDTIKNKDCDNYKN